ncbi:flagellar hook capping FlgD N-terminal domain-containing protein [Turneriella parva]|uniref:Basal-body rod modification protein FlgD n=1 Tax=Turneriella parva (strain ATCC BAA-1111 / DSM 21527 / NCTC 11395 / H) TaxID=869212 RepID=I4B436_TURPD|nr:flagellar hook capping FlgD N-terminal domain-containing protein [Turneriella parva]AFM12043.1 flagellar hook capping protein [Turneriella parva DSM 21527]
MPEVSLNPNQASGDAPQLTELLRNQRKMPVDRKGAPLPVRKSGYDALDKNSFLKLLVTQLSKQDPTNPMNDREFISQMAQFSSLEQMNNVANSMNKLRGTQANQLIGKMVEGKDFVTEKPVQGIVTTALYQPNGDVLLKVNGRFTKLDDITSVTEVTPVPNPTPSPSPQVWRGQQGQNQQNVSRETSEAASALTSAAKTVVQPPVAEPSAAQAAQAYETNQKAVNVSRETNGATAPVKAEAAPHKQQTKIEVPKGE